MVDSHAVIQWSSLQEVFDKCPLADVIWNKPAQFQIMALLYSSDTPLTMDEISKKVCRRICNVNQDLYDLKKLGFVAMIHGKGRSTLWYFPFKKDKEWGFEFADNNFKLYCPLTRLEPLENEDTNTKPLENKPPVQTVTQQPVQRIPPFGMRFSKHGKYAPTKM